MQEAALKANNVHTHILLLSREERKKGRKDGWTGYFEFDLLTPSFDPRELKYAGRAAAVENWKFRPKTNQLDQLHSLFQTRAKVDSPFPTFH